jgi:RNA polymerase sigma-70 factor (ECF subfamily)
MVDALALMDPGDRSSDSDLVARIARRDNGALALLYDRYAAAALALAARVTGDRMEAEDALQNAFVRLWAQAARFDPARGSVATWLLASVRHAAIDRVRRRETHRQAAERAAAGVPSRVDPPEEVASKDDRHRMSRAVESLPADQREAIELAYFQGLTQSQIAERLGQPLGTVKTRIRLGMNRLRQALAGGPPEERA